MYPNMTFLARLFAVLPRAVCGPLCLTSLLVAPGALPAQVHAPVARSDSDGVRTSWFPGSQLIAPPEAAPREVRTAIGPLAVDRDGDAQLGDVEAETALGYQLSAFRLAAGGPEPWRLEVGVEGGVFARLSPVASNFGLIEADFRVGFPVSMRRGSWQARLGWVHMSSHLGDDFLRGPGARYDAEVSRNGLTALLARRLGGAVRVYIGGDWNYLITPNVEKWAGRVGLEWMPVRHSSSRLGPHLALDLEIADLTGRLAGTGQGGVSFRTRPAILSVDLVGHVGPSPLGHFRSVHESYIGIMLSVFPAED